jgi:hypothetical protein
MEEQENLLMSMGVVVPVAVKDFPKPLVLSLQLVVRCQQRIHICCELDFLS